MNETERTALELRKAGVDYATIAERLNLSEFQAKEAVKTALKEVSTPDIDESDLEQKRLESLLLGIWKSAQAGQPAAVDRALHIMHLLDDAKKKKAALEAMEARGQPYAPPIEGLSIKQRVWVEAYLTTWNAKEAARVAGYDASSQAASQAGNKMLRTPIVQAAIRARLAAAQIEANEVIARLSEQARVNIGDFFQIQKIDGVDTLVLDAQAVKDRGHLIKAMKKNRFGDYDIVLHDGQAALVKLGEFRQVFVDRVEHTVEVKQSYDLTRLSEEDLRTFELLALKAQGEDVDSSNG